MNLRVSKFCVDCEEVCHVDSVQCPICAGAQFIDLGPLLQATSAATAIKSGDVAVKRVAAGSGGDSGAVGVNEVWGWV